MAGSPLFRRSHLLQVMYYSLTFKYKIVKIIIIKLHKYVVPYYVFSIIFVLEKN